MKVIHQQGDPEVARAYLAKFDGEKKYVEFVDSLGGMEARKEKWVIIVSSLFGCPIDCRFCDAGHFYQGQLNEKELMEQIEYLIEKEDISPKESDKFKVQFARIGEPSFNDSVIDVIEKVREKYSPPGYIPCISTIAPRGQENWFERLKELNRSVYKGSFQLQFSIHSTDEAYRDHLIPGDKWSLEEISDYGKEFFCGGRKVTLNFAFTDETPLDVDKLSSIFDPEHFAVKITPLNPTLNAEENDIVNVFNEEEGSELDVISDIEERGFDVYLSIGDLRENKIKSNCGQVLLSEIGLDQLES